MSSKTQSIMNVAVLGALVLGGGILGLVVASLVTRASIGPETVETLGWTFPLLFAGIAGGVAWLALFRGEDETPEPPLTAARCASCGGALVEDWRLCPYCGARIDERGSVSRDRETVAV